MSENSFNNSIFSSDPFKFTTGIFEPGKADNFCAGISDPEKKEFCKAELSYYRGDVFEAAQLFSSLARSDTPEISGAATLGTALAFLACDNSEEVINIYNTVCGLDELIPEGDFPLRKPTRIFLLFFNIMIHNFDGVQFPPTSIQSFDVPSSLKPMAFYVFTHYLTESGDIGRAVGMAEGALIFMQKPCPISEIYLCLIIARGYMLRKLWDKAEYYFRLAWSIAEPDGLIMPFAEFRGMLSGMLENCLRYEKPAEYKKISDLSNRYHSGWVKVHSELTGERISDARTATSLLRTFQILKFPTCSAYP